MAKQTGETGVGLDNPAGRNVPLAELLEMFPDDKTAMDWFEKNVWPDGRRCLRCGNRHTRDVIRNKQDRA